MISVVFFLLMCLGVSKCSKIRKGGLGSLWDLEKMTECRLNVTAFFTYNDYGCWCGPGGSGEPVDEIDRCCMYHDKCYDDAVNRKFCYDTPEEYLDVYTWSCAKNRTPICEEAQSACKFHLCWCDQTVVECWSNYPIPAKKKSCVHSSAISADRKMNLNTGDFTTATTDRSDGEDGPSVWAIIGNLIYSAWLFLPKNLLHF